MSDHQKDNLFELSSVRSKDRILTVLLVEDSESDAYTVERIIMSHMPCPCHVIHVATLGEAEGILSSESDIHAVLLDLGLPDSTGPKEVYSRMEVFKDRLPIIVLTSFEDHNMALSLLDGGVQDYVYKHDIADRPESLCRTVQFAIGRHHGQQASRKGILNELEQKDALLNLVTGGYSVTH